MSLVLDASAACELLFGGRTQQAVADAIEAHAHVIECPHLIDLEVLSVLRRKLAARELSPARAVQALADLRDLTISRYPHEPFALRIWELRSNFTPYDAAYVALAEAVDAELLTVDRKLQRAVRRHTDVVVPAVRA